jgi:hypothetical protein
MCYKIHTPVPASTGVARCAFQSRQFCFAQQIFPSPSATSSSEPPHSPSSKILELQVLARLQRLDRTKDLFFGRAYGRGIVERGDGLALFSYESVFGDSSSAPNLLMPKISPDCRKKVSDCRSYLSGRRLM